ncbi:hypothetical protein I4U23_021414 [Adineta vaga]|nr:hypothetical protein I4U23_021414 [Adineta vaga]
MNMIVQHRNLAQLDPSILLSYCPHYDERLALVLKNHVSHGMNKRNPLRRRELKKRLASRFLHKRMS